MGHYNHPRYEYELAGEVDPVTGTGGRAERLSDVIAEGIRRFERMCDAASYPQAPPPPHWHRDHWDHVAGYSPLAGTIFNIAWIKCPEAVT